MARLTEALKKALDLEDEELFPEEPEKGEKPGRSTQAQQIIDLALAAGIELFHTPDQTAYASIPVGGHVETWPVRKIRPWLSRLFYGKNEKPPGGQALQDALNVLEAKALFDGLCCPVNTRIAQQDGKIYIDLANESWQVVEVSSAGWRVLDSSPVKFRRTKGMLPLPVPQRGGTLDLLREFVNVADDNQWVLLASWLLACFSQGPYPVLLLQGEQGCAKSTTARVLKSLVDPNISHLRTSPRDERDLFVAATNSWVLAFDNLSGISDWLSDAFCRLSTGGGLATRRLYSDDEETIFEAKRPLVLNGIDDLAWRHDLLDRAIVLNLPVIPEAERKPEAEFWNEFQKASPYILGAILNAVAAGLRNLLNVKVDKLPRMADFALWVSACEEALPWEPGKFMEAYTGNRQEQIDSALENDPLAQAVKKLLDENGGSWEGTASELLEALEEQVDERVQKTRSWPGTPKALSGKLKRSATFLRQAGIEVEFARTKHARYIHIYCLGDANGDGGDAWKNFASPLEVPKNRPGDGGDANDDVFSLESKNQKREKQLDKARDFASPSSPSSPLRNDAGSKGDAKNKISSPDTIHRHPEITSTEQSKLWDALLAAITSEELRGLLKFAQTCGAELTFSSNGWRIEAKTALGSEYSSWRQVMLPYAQELREALAKLPPPSEQGGDNLPCQPGFTFSQDELWHRFLTALETNEARSLLEVARKRGARIVWDDKGKRYQIREDDILNREYIEWHKEALRFLGEVERALDSLVVREGEAV